MTTIREVAKKAGVSSTTVSHVINETRFVSADARERVNAAMKDLGYRPNALARSLRRGETRTLGLILPDSANPFFAEVGRNIEEASFDQGYSLILCNTEGDCQKENLYLDLLYKKQVDGIIFFSTGEIEGELCSLVAKEMPIVLVDRELPELEADVVLSDNLMGGYQAARRLIELGYFKIGCITGPSHLTPSAERVTGFRNAMEEAGLEVEAGAIERGDFHPHAGRWAALKMLQSPRPPQALFVINDFMAVGVLAAASELGLRVPQDLAVVGFDDIELARFTIPPLTTVSQKKREMGYKAVELLINRISSPSEPVQRTILPTSLVIRKSCGGME